MQEESENWTPTINHLPDEIISMILQNVDCRDIVYFGATCKVFNEMVNNDQCLWKEKFKSILPADLFEIVERHSNGDWLSEIKFFFSIKQKIHYELLAMSPHYYWRTSEVTFDDVKNFFAIALSNSVSYYYTIYILQNIIKKGKRSVDEQKCQKPFTLTEMYYAKVALRHLLHTYLAIKWVKAHVKDELTPAIVVNFFLQWIDTDNLHLDEDVENKIMEVVKKVELLMENNFSTKPNPDSSGNKCVKGPPTNERKILAAITQVMYHQRHMAVTSAANLDTLNIVKVLENKCGNVIAVAAVYQSVAKRLGVNCELIAFPNHLFLECRETSDYRSPQIYTVDLGTGELHQKRRCPFSQNNQNSNYKYSPDSLLQYLYASFHMGMGAIKNWNTQNALHLLDFLGTYDSEYNPYRQFLPFLLDFQHLPAMTAPLNLKYLSKTYLDIMNSLSNLNTAFKAVNRNIVVKTHDSRVKFAVGMICYHKKYDYTCIIRGWDQTCAVEWQRRMEIETLDFGPKQPFYHVIAADQSERYVAQENLTEVARPTRLYHLEDLIAREFTHFDGFAYVPNDEKKLEYPDDTPITNLFRSICELKSK